MLRNRTNRHLRLGLLLVVLSLSGCSFPPPEGDEPTPREVQKQLAQHLKERDHLLLNDLRSEGEGRYSGIAEGAHGVTYSVKANTQSRWLWYTADGRTLFSDGPFLRGLIPVPVSPFRDRHPDLMQWLRAIACVVQGLVVVWAVLGRFGYRSLYSPRMERLLVLSAAINLGFAMMFGYEFFTNLGAS
jgi:hypothetical protein